MPRAWFRCFLVIVFAVAITVSEGVRAEIEVNHTLWGALGSRSLIERKENQDNFLQMPQEQAELDWRPEIKWQSRVVLRPRVWLATERKRWAQQNESKTGVETQWLEAFFVVPGESWTLTLGKQNFQWGPAEFVSPSNRIFGENMLSKDLTFINQGRCMARLNYSPAALQNWNHVLMAELCDRGEPERAAETKFERKALVKSEYGSGANYVGLVLGLRERTGAWIGEYLNLELRDGLYFYLDASHFAGSESWYPTQDAATGIVTMSQPWAASSRVFSFAAVGLRYNFVDGEDLRLEMLVDETAYSREQVRLAWQALDSEILGQLALLSINGPRLAKRGFELPGRVLGSISLRVPQLFNNKDWNAYFRVLVSQQDFSWLGFLQTEYATGDRGTVFASLSKFGGPNDGELRTYIDWNLLAGYRHAW